jgi:prepilin-type processing-associated H-X9-DG protein
MATYGLPPGNRYSRTDYWPFRGINANTLTRCGGTPLLTPAAGVWASAALSVGMTNGGQGNSPSQGNAITGISDGTSNTLLMTEVAGRGLGAYVRGRQVAAITGTAPNPLPLVANPANNNGVGNQDVSQFARGTWADMNGTPVLYGQTPNAAGTAVDPNTGCGLINVSNFAGPYSMHTGGVNALRCDGSVAFVRDSVAPQNFFAFVTRSGGEVLTVD